MTNSIIKMHFPAHSYFIHNFIQNESKQTSLFSTPVWCISLFIIILHLSASVCGNMCKPAISSLMSQYSKLWSVCMDSIVWLYSYSFIIRSNESKNSYGETRFIYKILNNFLLILYTQSPNKIVCFIFSTRWKRSWFVYKTAHKIFFFCSLHKSHKKMNICTMWLKSCTISTKQLEKFFTSFELISCSMEVMKIVFIYLML